MVVGVLDPPPEGVDPSGWVGGCVDSGFRYSLVYIVLITRTELWLSIGVYKDCLVHKFFKILVFKVLLSIVNKHLQELVSRFV